MASSYFTESEAPRDFRVSSTESEGHYKKCLLCYTVKKNFYCPDCIRAGNFVHSSMPYADRYAEKQAKLLRLKANRKHILDRCEKLLASKLNKDTLLTEAKQSRDKLELLRLAIEQRRNKIDQKRKELTELRNYNNELSLKLPKYQKRVSNVGKHAQMQRLELDNKVSMYNEQAESLAALRRSRIRQLTNYIFPVYMSYDTSESIEDMEFIGEDTEEEPPKRPQLHIVAPWINTDGDYSQVHSWVREGAEGAGAAGAGAGRVGAALSLCAQLLALLGWLLDVRLPYTISLNEYSNWRVSESGASWRARRIGACGAALCARASLPAPPPAHCLTAAPAPAPTPHALCALHALVLAATTDEPMLGRVEPCSNASNNVWTEAIAALGDLDHDDVEPPEHLHWPETNELEELSAPPPAPAPSLVSSLASVWRVLTK